MNEWDIIAENFDATRRRPWLECLEFLENINGICLDIGCGNGRHLLYMADHSELAIGVDSSIKMIEVARGNVGKERKKNVLLVNGNACRLPFPDNTFDGVLFIAALHNIKGRENRLNALREVKRVLKPERKALISVWAKWQDRWRKYFLLHPLRHGNIYVPWRRGVEALRFYHLYSMGEFRREIKRAGLFIERVWSVRKASKKYADNHFAVVRKRLADE